MRTEGQIKHQLRQVVFRHLQRLLRENFRKRPDTCIHNGVLVLDDATGASVGICGHLSSEGRPRNLLCDARIQGCLEMARECPRWSSLQMRDEIKAEFQTLVRSEDRGVIASQYPDVAALLWVLDAPGSLPSEVELDAQTETAEESPHPEGWGVV